MSVNRRVCIITINYNQNDYTLKCIESVLKSDFPGFLLFLIDNGSSEANFSRLKKSLPTDKRIILERLEKNRGYVGGVNFGLKTSGKLKPDYYIIMNNDTIIDSLAISELVRVADKFDQKAIISGKVYHLDNKDIIQNTGMIFTDKNYLKGYSPGKNEKDIGQCDQLEERDSLDDILWLLPAKIVDDIGYYCEYYFMYAEQGDYAQTARRKGYKLIYTPDAKIWHKGSLTSGGGNKQALPVCYWRAKSSFVFSFRNLKFRYFFIRNVTLFIKLLLKIMFFKGEEKKCAIAKFRGLMAGIRWFFHQKPDNGYNPYVKSV